VVTVAVRVVGIEAFVAALVHVVIISVLTSTANTETSALDATIFVTMGWASVLGVSGIDIACTVLMDSSGVTTGRRGVAVVVLRLLVRQSVGGSWGFSCAVDATGTVIELVEGTRCGRARISS